MPDSDHVIGSVKWFDTTKGYGFVVLDGRDIFVHSKRMKGPDFATKDQVFVKLDTGDKLKFKIEKGPKGEYATDISKV